MKTEKSQSKNTNKTKNYSALTRQCITGYSIIGIDEAGRGPLAGPVSVGGVLAPQNMNTKILKGIKDSKKLSEKKREEWFEKIKDNFKYSVVMVSPQDVDRIGISKSIQFAVNKVLDKLSMGKNKELVLLDGFLKAPEHFNNQKSFIKGDEKIPLISAASIMAKVLRDREMRRLHEVYPKYGLDRHKGYGTKAHFEAIEKYGILEIHRRSYLKKRFPELT